MTQREFDLLPALLTKAQFALVTGLERRQIHDLVVSKQLRVWKASPAGYGRYYKSEAAKISGYDLK